MIMNFFPKAPLIALGFVLTAAVASANFLPNISIPVTQNMADFWQVVGSAQMTQNKIALTRPPISSQSQSGAIWSRVPFPYMQDWEVVLKFKVTGSEDAVGGQGMALFLSEDPAKLGPVFGSRDYFKGLALVFDTYDNDNLRNNPSISAHYFDGTKSYNHADDGLSTQIAGCIADFRSRDNPVLAKMTYTNNVLSVWVDLFGTGSNYRRCLEKPAMFNRDKPWYVGVSAQTLDVEAQDLHEILSIQTKGTISFGQNPQVPPPQQQQAPPQQQQVPPPQQQQQQQQQVPPPQQQQAPPQQQQQQQQQNSGSAVDVGGIPNSAAVHDKLDHLVKAAAHTVVEAQGIGEALTEVEGNVLKHVTATAKALYSRLGRVDLSMKIDELAQSVQTTKASIDAGRLEAERVQNEMITKVSSLQSELKLVQETLERSSRAQMSIIDRRLRERLSVAADSSSGGLGLWLYIGLFQALFVAFMIYRHMSKKKDYDKLL